MIRPDARTPAVEGRRLDSGGGATCRNRTDDLLITSALQVKWSPVRSCSTLLAACAATSEDRHSEPRLPKLLPTLSSTSDRPHLPRWQAGPKGRRGSRLPQPRPSSTTRAAVPLNPTPPPRTPAGALVLVLVAGVNGDRPRSSLRDASAPLTPSPSTGTLSGSGRGG